MVEIKQRQWWENGSAAGDGKRCGGSGMGVVGRWPSRGGMAADAAAAAAMPASEKQIVQASSKWGSALIWAKQTNRYSVQVSRSTTFE